VELSGAAMIKIMQWAGSRPDMFGRDFCSVFSQLQDDTTPHPWKYTEQVMIDAYGENWHDHVTLGEILGSGCIAQVYKGLVRNDSGVEQPVAVAVKVMHPNVEDDIDADLDILRVTVRLLEYLNVGPIRNMKWLNLPGFIEEMAIMLKIQLDLRTEGEHLVQFNKNFKGNHHVIFPDLVKGYTPTKHILFETFCEGVPIMDFVRENKADRSLLSKMCEGAVKAVCQMIFLGMSLRRFYVN
jgi:aarF domain-containing kinase